jgi:hypothetical protein
VKHYTPNSATPVGTNSMFLQIGKRYTPFSAFHQFFPTLPIICAQVAAKRFMRITRWCPFKIKKKMSNAPIMKHYPPVNTTFDPP